MVQVKTPTATRPPRNNYNKAKVTERIARSHIERLGYADIVQTTSTGPDLIGFKDGRAWMFEVKGTFRWGNKWVTNPVLPARIKDHFIAIVLPNGFVYVEPMAAHLRSCHPSGIRDVTRLVQDGAEPQGVDLIAPRIERNKPGRLTPSPIYSTEEAEEMKRRILGGAA
jgi:hypothetical protein